MIQDTDCTTQTLATMKAEVSASAYLASRFREDEGGEDHTWIVVGACAGAIVLVVLIFLFITCCKNRNTVAKVATVTEFCQNGPNEITPETRADSARSKETERPMNTRIQSAILFTDGSDCNVVKDL